MPTIEQVCGFMEEIAPSELAESWDNVGLLVQSGEQASKILVCLDITTEVVQEAKRLGCELVVSHHPVIFNPLRLIRMDSPVFALVQNGISALCAHTNLDAAKDGVNDVLAERLGVENPVLMGEIGRIGTLPKPVTGQDFAEHCKQVLATSVQLADADKPIRKVALVGGAGGSYWQEAEQAGADCFVTGEASHHNALDALAQGLTLVVAGHYATEWPVVEDLAKRLRTTFAEAQVFVSETNRAPFVFV